MTFAVLVLLTGLWLGAGPAAGTTQRALPERGTYLAVDEAGGLVAPRDAAWAAGESPSEDRPASSTGSTPYVIDLRNGESARVLSLDAWHAVKAFPASEQVTAASKFWCESKWDRHAVGASGEVNIPQVHGIHAPMAARLGYSWGDVASDPSVAGLVARAVWDVQGWAAWSC